MNLKGEERQFDPQCKQQFWSAEETINTGRFDYENTYLI